jgi:hypothetical protein
VDLAGFRLSLSGQAPPAGTPRPLAALWHCARGEWDAAHRLVQADEGEPDHDWVHAHLHRVEGDIANAGYWYRSAGRPPARGSLEAEWAEVATALLARHAATGMGPGDRA